MTYAGRDVVVHEPGSLNYHCAACGALLVRDAGAYLPDVVVICPICLALNEVVDRGVRQYGPHRRR